MNQRKYALELIFEARLAGAQPIFTPLEFQNLSQYMQQPKHSHWNSALRVIKYIKGSPGSGLLMSSHKDTRLTGFCDADWTACVNTRRSMIGCLLKFGDSLISWKSKKHNTISRSSAEVEYRSLTTLTKEVVWVTGLFKESCVNLESLTIIHCDSKAALEIVVNPVFHERTKHIEIDCHFIHEKILQGLIRTNYINSKEQ
ncbi:secreted RxLR effector protein 161-like [Solanum lycopersicum]|uniref:secreted RxLR effector protein 161-like n=1 Tax=Solanum lycopersicum TaxID=4081 RepID=UPI003748E2B9